MALKSIIELDQKINGFIQGKNDLQKLLKELTVQIRTGNFTDKLGKRATDLPAFKAAEDYLKTDKSGYA